MNKLLSFSSMMSLMLLVSGCGLLYDCEEAETERKFTRGPTSKCEWLLVIHTLTKLTSTLMKDVEMSWNSY